MFAVAAALLLSVDSTRAQEAAAIRPLAPGVLTVIPPAGEDEETFTGPVPMVEVVNGIPDLDWTPNFDAKTRTLQEMAKTAIFRRPIWNLEFAFKPMRMIDVDVLQANGRIERKLIWYMVYRVTNRGHVLNPVPSEDALGQKVYQVDRANFDFQTLRFFPHFVLENRESQKSYLDRVIPAAQELIQIREHPGVRLYNSVEITAIKIPISEAGVERGVWGVVTWEDVDPRTDFFSVYVRGLTNAFKFVDPPGAYKAGDPPFAGRVFAFKTLQLNFWRPSDSVLEHEREIRFGIPVEPDPERQQRILSMFGLKDRLDYLWIYR